MATKTVAQLTAVISANNTKFKKGISGSKKQLSGFQKSVRSIGPMIAGAFAAGAIINFTKEASRASAEAEGIKRAFAALNDRGLLDELRASVKGTVSDVRLMQSAVKANNFKIPLEQLGKFFQFAQKRAIETGESVDYLVESITNGIARKSLPILDNLGLSATEVRDEFKKTGDMASAVANIIARDMGDVADATLTTAELYDQARANAENLKVEVGELINLGVNKLLPMLNKMVGFLREAFMTQRMIKRQVLDADILYQIEQDRAQVLFVANKHREDGLSLLKGQTYEQKAALSLLKGYRQILARVDETDAARIEKLSAQILELEYMSGITPRPGSITDKDTMGTVISSTYDAIDALEALNKKTAQLNIFGDLTDFDSDDVLGGIFDEEEGPISEPKVDALVARFNKTKNAALDLSDTLAQSFAQIGSSFADSLGEVAAGTKTLEESLKEISALILESLGDILILTGLSTSPVGVPLVLAGLALKGIGSFVGSVGGGSVSSGGGTSPFASSGSGSSFSNANMLYGNDIRNSNSYYTNLYNRVG